MTDTEYGPGSTRFGVTVDELRTLFEEYKYPNLLEPLEALGGVEAIGRKLDTNLKDGLSLSEAETAFAERKDM